MWKIAEMWKIADRFLNNLEMPEEVQITWLTDINVMHITRDASGKNERLESLAELAFRLRDDMVKGNLSKWQKAMDIVFLKVSEEHWKEEHEFARWPAVMFWLSHVAKPIHWIIIALIVKEVGDNVYIN